MGNRGEDLHFLAHAFGERVGGFVGEIFESVTFEQFIGARPGGFAVQAFEGGKVSDDGPGFHFLVKALFFGKVTEPVTHFERRRRTKDGDVAGGRFDDLQDHADTGRFACAIGAEKSANRAWLDGEALAVDSFELAVELCDLAQLEGGTVLSEEGRRVHGDWFATPGARDVPGPRRVDCILGIGIFETPGACGLLRAEHVPKDVTRSVYWPLLLPNIFAAIWRPNFCICRCEERNLS